MNLREARAGAPLYRGRLSAIVWLWLAGLLMGDTDIGIVWPFVSSYPDVDIHWEIDIVMLLGSLGCLVMGVLALDRYGRNAWFAWAPDDAEWSGLTRDTVNRAPRLRAWLYRFRLLRHPDGT